MRIYVNQIHKKRKKERRIRFKKLSSKKTKDQMNISSIYENIQQQNELKLISLFTTFNEKFQDLFLDVTNYDQKIIEITSNI